MVLVFGADDIDYPKRGTAKLSGEPYKVLQGAHDCGVGKEDGIHCRIKAVFLEFHVPAEVRSESQPSLNFRH